MLGHDSFYVGLDGVQAAGVNEYIYDLKDNDSFTWDNVRFRGPNGNSTYSQYNPKVWSLTSGLHTFTFYGRETDTRLDQIILKNIQQIQCGDGNCSVGETCLTDSCCNGQPYNPSAQICCSDNVHTGDCCDINDCSGGESCINNVCTEICIDNDGDGYGDPASSVCTHPQLDCDDGKSNVNPGKTEICSDGLDNDCSNGDRNCQQCSQGQITTRCVCGSGTTGRETGYCCNGIWSSMECSSPVIIATNYYNGRTTDFSNVNLSSINNMILERTDSGMIRFDSKIQFPASRNLDIGTNITRYSAYINSSMHPMLNISARISFYNVTLNNPIIFSNNELCPESICRFVSFANQTFDFNVTHFSNYTIEGRCSDDTLYNECSASKPKFCSDGTLIDRCSLCGCSSGYVCSDDVCTEQTTGPVSYNPPTSSSPPASPGDTETGECSGNETRQCDLGICKGTQSCMNGQWSECNGPSPGTEVCDYKDNDCNGIIDDIKVMAETGEILGDGKCYCYIGQERPCGKDEGICQSGTSYCRPDGTWGTCEGSIEPTADSDICGDNLDNDCDGQTDENCDSGQDTCTNGMLDDNEEGIDCGGACPNECENFLVFLSFTLVTAGLLMICIGIPAVYIGMIIRNYLQQRK